ncbi:MAG: hypothetical protein WCC12_18835 [Anaerolineales bacterium]
MSNLREQIRDRMNLRETEELLEIWRNNQRFEWSDDAFGVIEEILKQRGVDIPEQNEPVYENQEEAEEENVEDYSFSDEGLSIIDDENSPDFYDPFDVLLTTKRIDWIAKVMIVFTIVYNIIYFQTFMGIVQSYFFRNPNSVLVYILTILLIAVSSAVGVVAVYFPLKALAYVLRILMEMEFRSRKGI